MSITGEALRSIRLEYRPIAGIDTRPHAIFFSLIALVMLLVASGTRTHAILIDLAFPHPEADVALGFPYDRVTLTDDNRILWNSAEVTKPQLAANLDERVGRPYRQGLIFDPQQNANYPLALEVLAQIKATGNAGAGFCFGDLSPYRNFAKAGAPSPGLAASDLGACRPAEDSRFVVQPWMPTER